MRRRLGAVVLSAAVFVALLPAPAPASIPKAITWRVDHTAKTITISVRMTLYPACDDPTCQLGPMDAQIVRNQILSVWDQGFYYKCYRLIFDVDVQVDNSATRWSDSPDRLMIRFDQNAGVDFRSDVQRVRGGAWNSDSPSDKVVPVNDWLAPSTWSGTVIAPFVYAHEFGHLIGLSDTYTDHLTLDGWESRRIPGAPVDVMSGGDLGNVDQVTIDRLVKRSGVVKDSDLQCDIKIDTSIRYGKAVFTWTGTKCDPPTGQWNLAVTGSYPGMSWEGTTKVRLAADLTGPYQMDLTWTVPGLAPGGDTMAGEARFDPGTNVSSASAAKPQLMLGPFSGSTWIAGVSGDIGAGSTTLTGTYGDFC